MCLTWLFYWAFSLNGGGVVASCSCDNATTWLLIRW